MVQECNCCFPHVTTNIVRKKLLTNITGEVTETKLLRNFFKVKKKKIWNEFHKHLLRNQCYFFSIGSSLHLCLVLVSTAFIFNIRLPIIL